jgi:hypothetical protein
VWCARPRARASAGETRRIYSDCAGLYSAFMIQPLPCTACTCSSVTKTKRLKGHDAPPHPLQLHLKPPLLAVHDADAVAAHNVTFCDWATAARARPRNLMMLAGSSWCWLASSLPRRVRMKPGQDSRSVCQAPASCWITLQTAFQLCFAGGTRLQAGGTRAGTCNVRL